MFEIDASFAHGSLHEVCLCGERDCGREAQTQSRRDQNPKIQPGSIMSHWVRHAASRETGFSEKTPDPSVGPEKFAEMIVRHWDGIAAYCKPEDKVVLGFAEGMNKKVRVIQRRSCGLRDEVYLRLKVLTCMLDPI